MPRSGLHDDLAVAPQGVVRVLERQTIHAHGLAGARELRADCCTFARVGAATPLPGRPAMDYLTGERAGACVCASAKALRRALAHARAHSGAPA
eukprot:15458250-Alexandrium_andersonii.AAC.1